MTRLHPYPSDMGRRVLTTRTGLRIGSAYTPKPSAAMDRDHERLQRALLDERTAGPRTGVVRAFSFLWRAT